MEHNYRTWHAIDAARNSGVKHIIYISLGFGGNLERSTVCEVMKAHIDTENYLESLAKLDPSFTFTVIRGGIHSESFPIYTAFFNLKSPPDEVRIPHDGLPRGISWVKRDELGEGSARLIVQYLDSPEPFPYVNTLLILSGPREVTLTETVKLLGNIVEKNVPIQKVTPKTFANQPQVKAASNYTNLEKGSEWAISRGEAATVTPILRQLLGREQEQFEKTVADMNAVVL